MVDSEVDQSVMRSASFDITLSDASPLPSITRIETNHLECQNATRNAEFELQPSSNGENYDQQLDITLSDASELGSETVKNQFDITLSDASEVDAEQGTYLGWRNDARGHTSSGESNQVNTD